MRFDVQTSEFSDASAFADEPRESRGPRQPRGGRPGAGQAAAFGRRPAPSAARCQPGERRGAPGGGAPAGGGGRNGERARGAAERSAPAPAAQAAARARRPPDPDDEGRRKAPFFRSTGCSAPLPSPYAASAGSNEETGRMAETVKVDIPHKLSREAARQRISEASGASVRRPPAAC